MKKILTLFERDRNTHLVINQVTPGCEWVLAGEGVVTRKLNGTCCLIQGGKLYKRRELARHNNAFPDGFVAAGPPDPVTGKIQGWMPVTASDKWHLEAFDANLGDGTYELMGPKIQGNDDDLDRHVLVPHGIEIWENIPRTFWGLRTFLYGAPKLEGFVFHHPDSRMAKIKRKDFFQ